MTKDEWDRLCDAVTEKMRRHTRPYVTPLSSDPPNAPVTLEGTGSYVDLTGERILLTCEHVAVPQLQRPGLNHRFNGSPHVFASPSPWQMDKHPIDAAYTTIPNTVWNSVPHKARAIPISRFARQHLTVADELLFFRGYAGQNAQYGFGVHQTNGSGYCSQEVRNSGDAQVFDIFWDPAQTRFTGGTAARARAAVQFTDPAGFSGSLVWNTRFVEHIAAGKPWSPRCAVVTGMVRRWDTSAKSLIVWRVEHLRNWLGL